MRVCVCESMCVCVVVVVVVESRLRPTRLTGVGLVLFMVRLHSPSYLDILSNKQVGCGLSQCSLKL